MPGHDTIVVGASAGGVEALLYLADELPPTYHDATTQDMIAVLL